MLEFISDNKIDYRVFVRILMCCQTNFLPPVNNLVPPMPGSNLSIGSGET
jgi:hypothetical protein